MNVLKKFTIKNLKLNRKRTIVTIIGIILSTALICGVAGIVSSFQQTLINFAKSDGGNYHTLFYNVPKDETKYMENNVDVEQTFCTSQIGWADLKVSKNVNKPYINIYEYDEKALQNNAVKLVAGRLPQNSNEIVISQHMQTNGRIEVAIGDTITLDVGKRIAKSGEILTQDNPFDYEEGKVDESIVDTVSKQYTVVGIMARPNYVVEGYSAPGYTAITYMESKDKDIYDVYVLYNNPKDYEKSTNQINGIVNEDDAGKYETYINKELLRYQGAIGENTLRVLYGIASVIIVIIVVSSVFVIRNSFIISVAEKTKQYGMMSSIGATKKQIKKTVLLEGLYIGFIGIPLGILSGIGAIMILLQIVNYLLGDMLRGLQFVYKLPFEGVVLSIIIASITIYLSCIIPARKAAKISPVEAIRGNNDIKIKAKKIKTSKLFKKVFGIGGVIANKNLKRNKKKYRTTIISIVVSIVMFVSLSSFMHYGNITSEVYYTEMKYNIYARDSERNVEVYKKIAQFDGIENYAYYYQGSEELDIEKYGTEIGKEMNANSEKSANRNPIIVVVYNNEYFKQYIKSLGINENEYNKATILIDDFLVHTTEGKRVIDHIYSIDAGDTIDISLNGKENVKITQKTMERPMGLEKTYSNSGYLIVSQDYVGAMNSDEYILDSLFIKATNSIQVENVINDRIKEDSSFYSLKVDNLDTYVTQQNRMVLVISIFLYGFITVITLIGVTNIFNTITTNMILRSKEFAMLKSIGMTKKEFNKMIRLESILYGLKSLIIGIPLGILGSYAMYESFAESIDAGYELPIKAILISIVFVFIIVGTTMRYSLHKINKQNIIETIRKDNI